MLGGSSGIGLAVAQQVVARGARAIIASSNAERVKQAATLDGKAKGHTLDLSNERNIQNFFQRIGDFDHLVFTAGDRLQLNELVAMDLTKARHAFELRYGAALAAVKYASPQGSTVFVYGPRWASVVHRRRSTNRPCRAEERAVEISGFSWHAPKLFFHLLAKRKKLLATKAESSMPTRTAETCATGSLGTPDYS